MGIRIRVENVRVSFAEGLSVASAFEEGQTKKYGADFLLVPGSAVKKKTESGYVKVASVTDILMEAAVETWKTPEAAKAMLKALEASRKSIRRGDTRVNKSGDVYEGYAGVLYIAAKSKQRPTLLDRQGLPLSEDQRSKIYSGCYVTAIIDIYGVSDPKRKGVFAGLSAVQFVRDGDAFAGGAPVTADDIEDLGAEDGEELAQEAVAEDDLV